MKREKKCNLLDLFPLQNGKLYISLSENQENLRQYQYIKGVVEVRCLRSGNDNCLRAQLLEQSKEYVGFHCLHS